MLLQRDCIRIVDKGSGWDPAEAGERHGGRRHSSGSSSSCAAPPGGAGDDDSPSHLRRTACALVRAPAGHRRPRRCGHRDRCLSLPARRLRARRRRAQRCALPDRRPRSRSRGGGGAGANPRHLRLHGRAQPAAQPHVLPFRQQRRTALSVVPRELPGGRPPPRRRAPLLVPATGRGCEAQRPTAPRSRGHCSRRGSSCLSGSC